MQIFYSGVTGGVKDSKKIAVRRRAVNPYKDIPIAVLRGKRPQGGFNFLKPYQPVIKKDTALPVNRDYQIRFKGFVTLILFGEVKFNTRLYKGRGQDKKEEELKYNVQERRYVNPDGFCFFPREGLHTPFPPPLPVSTLRREISSSM